MSFTVTYASFQDGSGYYAGYTGGSTAPTQAQSFTRNLVSLTLNFTDTDTTFTLTHNFNLTTAQLACLLPLVNINPGGSVFTVSKAANTVTLTKLQATGSGSTVQVDIRRPGTPGY